MSNNVSFDVGNSNTSITVYKNGQLQSFLIDDDSFIKSEVAYKDNKFYFGKEAREKILEPGVKYFKNFKLLLAETDPKILIDNGYDKISVEKVTKAFMTYLIEKYLKESKINIIDKLYVGIPEVVYEKESQFDYSEKLIKIIESIQYNGQQAVKEVYLVSEPTGTASYAIVEYERRYNRKFDGYVLTIDLGGGTVDLTLNKVIKNGSNELSDIMVIKRFGIGENTRSRKGESAIAFLERALTLSLGNHWNNKKDNQFYWAYNQLEKAVIEEKESIDFIFDDYLKGSFNLKILEDIDEELTSIKYFNKNIQVTYGILAKAYFQINYDSIDQLLDKMIEYMEENSISYQASVKEAVKIIISGGFSNFYLTQLQIERKFNKLLGNDLRFPVIKDKDNAVANGLCYIANDQIHFKKTCPYSLGIGTDNKLLAYAFLEGDSYDTDVPKYIMKKDINGNLTEAKYYGSYIPCLYFNNQMLGTIKGKALTRELKQKLSLNNNKVFSFGFSLDRNEVFSLHIKTYQFTFNNNKREYHLEHEQKITLTNLTGWFGGLIEVE